MQQERREEKDWNAMGDEELIDQAVLSEVELDILESDLRIRAGCLNWSGDPLKQPVPVVASLVRRILSDRT